MKTEEIIELLDENEVNLLADRLKCEKEEALKEVLEIVKNVNEEDYKYIEFKIREMMEK